MALPPETEEYLMASIECSLGLEISPKNMKLKLLASEDARLRIQNQVIFLEGRINEATRKVEQNKAEAMTNAKELKQCVADKAGLMVNIHQLSSICEQLQRDCSSFESNMRRYMDALEENARENKELRAIPPDLPEEEKLIKEIEALEKDKMCLLTNITKAEEEAAVLIRENRVLEIKHNRLLRLVEMQRLRQRGSTVSKNKRKPEWDEQRPREIEIDNSSASSASSPNSPESRME